MIEDQGSSRDLSLTASCTGRVEVGLAFIDSLDKREQRAFLGLFAGARFPWTIYDRNDSCPTIGKAECEWVEDWRGFYAERLPAAGLFKWEEGESGDALGMVRKENGDYHRWTRINCGPTALGRMVRDAYWERHDRRVDERMSPPPVQQTASSSPG